MLKEVKYSEHLIKGFPLRHQLDNALYPGGSCNMTSLAMCLQYFKKKVTPNYGYDQLEDALLATCDDEGLSRHDPATIALLADRFGLSDELIMIEGWDQVGKALYGKLIPHLVAGFPVITHGLYVEPFGHIVCVDGIRLEDGKPVAWHHADPFGEWYRDGYNKNYGGDPALGRYWMSHASFTATALKDGILWVHLIKS
ncbi:C39 family peptidase [Chroococcidiopsis sp.]|uniref:C39 family peptidase n=1 Tax=Chroococcidiopsis sp. TaxID=3088168 RepID=UPI003F2E47D2